MTRAKAGNHLAQHRGRGGPQVTVLRLADLSVGYSPRQIKVDEDHVAALAEIVDRFPPIVVEERSMTVLDGVHRVEASRRAGRAEIRALLFSGSETEALVVAIQANISHGKPLTRSERQAAAGTLLRRCPDRSDRWVGEVCGLSHSTVARLRQAVKALGTGVRTGRDGRRRPIDPTPGQVAAAKALADGPARSIRQAAGAAGVAPSTMQRVAARHRGHPGLSPVVPRSVAPLSAAAGVVVELTPGRTTPRPETAAWWERTAVDPEDLVLYLDDLPLGRIYEAVDECRRRARMWAAMADALERRLRDDHGPRAQ